MGLLALPMMEKGARGRGQPRPSGHTGLMCIPWFFSGPSPVSMHRRKGAKPRRAGWDLAGGCEAHHPSVLFEHMVPGVGIT